MPDLSPFYHVDIYRPANGSDCTNGGVSARFTKAVLYRLEKDEPLPANSPDWTARGYAVLRLDTSPKAGPEPYPRAVPHGERRWCMAGGNFVWSCDSTFRREVCERPIPVHDRIES